jgi:predicted metal-dependent enzyme (double-stranded beta helix superfamily)
VTSFDIDQFILNLRAAAKETGAVVRVRHLMDEAFKNPTAIEAAMPDYATDDEILFEDDSVSIWFCRFVPGLHVPPHDHQTTATIGVYRGAEDNHFYLREGDQLVQKSTRRIGVGEVISIKPDGIHSVEAANQSPSLAIHVYLARLTTIERSLFDWDDGNACPFTDENYETMKRVG